MSKTIINVVLPILAFFGGLGTTYLLFKADVNKVELAAEKIDQWKKDQLAYSKSEVDEKIDKLKTEFNNKISQSTSVPENINNIIDSRLKNLPDNFINDKITPLINTRLTQVQTEKGISVNEVKELITQELNKIPIKKSGKIQFDSYNPILENSGQANSDGLLFIYFTAKPNSRAIVQCKTSPNPTFDKAYEVQSSIDNTNEEGIIVKVPSNFLVLPIKKGDYWKIVINPDDGLSKINKLWID